MSFEADFTYTKIPNYFLDHQSQTLSATELRVMLYLYRHTLGWQKLADSIAYTQFVDGITTSDGKRIDSGAGVSRSSLAAALPSLVGQGLITVTPGTGRQANRYHLTRLALYGSPTEPLAVQNLDYEQPVAVQIPNQHEEKESQKEMTGRGTEIAGIILSGIGDISPKQAHALAATALHNGRNLAYIIRLIAYVSTATNIRNRAAVLTSLVNSDLDRLPSKPHTKAVSPPDKLDFAKYLPGGKYGYLSVGKEVC